MLHHILIALGLVAVLGAAQAADIGECATPEAMTAKLKTEDQRSIASAQLITPDKRLFGMIFTMSSDRKVGYILKADQPLGDRASQICVYNRMADIRLFDARQPGVPRAALLKAPEADALKRCDVLATEGKFPRASCNSLNTMVQLSAASGNRVILQGFGVAKAPDGRYRAANSLTTLSGNVSGSINDHSDDPSRGIVGDLKYSSLPDGASIINATLVYVRYTEYGLAALQ